MHICSLLSQIPGCSRPWCYSYACNSKRLLDQPSAVKITHWEKLQTYQQNVWMSNEDGRGKTCFPFSDFLFGETQDNPGSLLLFSVFLSSLFFSISATVEDPNVPVCAEADIFHFIFPFWIRTASGCSHLVFIQFPMLEFYTLANFKQTL